jgi:hypothetical protein
MLNIIQGEGDIYITPDEHAKYYTVEGDIYIKEKWLLQVGDKKFGLYVVLFDWRLLLLFCFWHMYLRFCLHTKLDFEFYNMDENDKYHLPLYNI